MTTQFTGTQIKGVESIWPSVGDGLNPTEGDEDEHQIAVVFPGTPGSNSELSYVLNVPQPDEKSDTADGDEHMTVLDFDDAEDPAAVNSDSEDVQMKITKLYPKKSQVVDQEHTCKYCNYKTPKRYLLTRHLKRHSEDRPHKCSVCERGFKILASLQIHMNRHTGAMPHLCKFCNAAFATSSSLKRHVRYRHTHEKPHKCNECDYASVELSKLKKHMLFHTGEGPYQCPHCTFASPNDCTLTRHLIIHTGEKPYCCDICDAGFTESNTLKAHRLTHNVGDKPVFRCKLCPTTCGRKKDLRVHVRKFHTTDKLLNSKRCVKQIPDRYSNELHMKTHEGEKCYKDSHMLVHTDQKPYQCSQCDQWFRQKHGLKRHEDFYHNPTYAPKEKTHECSECGSKFCRKCNLTRHMALHDPELFVMEKQLALKLGRQKKIQIVDGQQVELSAGFECDDELEEDVVVDEELFEDRYNNVMSVEGADVEQHVVYNVSQLADDEILSELMSHTIMQSVVDDLMIARS